MSLLVNAILQKESTYVDKGHKIELVTGEITDEQAGQINGLLQKYVNCYITEGEVGKEAKEILDTETVDKSQIKAKTPSQRLRSALFKLCEQENKGEDFEVFYALKMELLIEQIKDRLE